MLTRLFFSLLLAVIVHGSVEHVAEMDLKTGQATLEPVKGKSPEDSIPVIEIRGEGKPMTAAQIRQLEEETEGRPMDIKIKHTWRPRQCARAAKRKDFITFHYKAFLEDNKKIDQSYGREPLRMQLGVGMAMPGLEKGLRGMCDTELRRIDVPWRLSRKKKSKVWKYIPNEEHWLKFDIEMLSVEPWTMELQFDWMDRNNDTFLTQQELIQHADMVRKEFGKHWPSEDIDTHETAKFFVQYFDHDKNSKISKEEYVAKMKKDMNKIGNQAGKKVEGRRRDPGLGWVFDFNNDGVVSLEELDKVPDILEQGYETYIKSQKTHKDEL